MGIIEACKTLCIIVAVHGGIVAITVLCIRMFATTYSGVSAELSIRKAVKPHYSKTIAKAIIGRGPHAHLSNAQLKAAKQKYWWRMVTCLFLLVGAGVSVVYQLVKLF